MKQVVEKREDIAFFIKLYPLSMHKDAKRKAESIQCKKSLTMLEEAFAGKAIPDPTCETDVIDKNIELVKELGITGTPVMIFDDGRMIPGFVQADKIIELVDKK